MTHWKFDVNKHIENNGWGNWQEHKHPKNMHT